MKDIIDHHWIKGLKVAIISATFHPDRSYQENLWSEGLVEFGAKVRLFHPCTLNSSALDVYRVTPSTGLCYEAERVPTLSLPHNIFLTRELGDRVSKYDPQLIIWFGGIMYFGRSLCDHPALQDVPTLTIFSLSRRGRHAFSWDQARLSLRDRVLGLSFQLLRSPDLIRAIRRSTFTIANTPECTEIIRRFVHGELRTQWARKHLEIPLGFCPHTFSYRPELRVLTRETLGLTPRDRVILFSTRFQQDKWPAIEQCFKVIEEVMLTLDQATHHASVHMMWIGLDQGETSQRFRMLLNTSSFSQAHHPISFQSRLRLSAFYHAADIALFPQPSISCQEAMGTGAWILHPPDPSLDHLLPITGWGTCAPYKEWAETLVQLCVEDHLLDDPKNRSHAAQYAQKLSYHHLIIETLKHLPN